MISLGVPPGIDYSAFARIGQKMSMRPRDSVFRGRKISFLDRVTSYFVKLDLFDHESGVQSMFMRKFVGLHKFVKLFSNCTAE
jgi:hypothetical protein